MCVYVCVISDPSGSMHRVCGAFKAARTSAWASHKKRRPAFCYSLHCLKRVSWWRRGRGGGGGGTRHCDQRKKEKKTVTITSLHQNDPFRTFTLGSLKFLDFYLRVNSPSNLDHYTLYFKIFSVLRYSKVHVVCVVGYFYIFFPIFIYCNAAP